MKHYKKILFIIILLNVISPIYCISQEWEWQNPLPTGNRIYCMDFVDSLTGWFGSSAGTILHTTDGGNSWEIQHTGNNYLFIKSIDFINNREGWSVGSPNLGTSYLLHTINSGKDWVVQFTDSSHSFSFITFKDQKHGWVGTYGGDIYYTTDGGETWKLGYTGQGYVRSIVFLDTLHGWAEGQGGMPLLHSTDGGRNWIADTTGIVGTTVFFSDSMHGWIGSWETLWHTVDGGKTWLDDLPKFTDWHSLIIDVFFVDSLTGWATAHEEGIYRTVDGGWTWDKLDSNTRPYVFFNHCSGWIGFSRTYDAGKTLVNQKEGITFSHLTDVDFIDKNKGWVVGWGGLIGMTSDGGKIWEVQDSGTESKLTHIFALNESIVWVIGGDLFLKTKNGGETWELQQYQFDTYHYPQAVSFIDSLKGWMVGGKYETGGWILYTKDGGETWIEQTPEVIPVLYDVTFMNENKGWAVGTGAVYHTKDAGETWNNQLENQHYGLRSVCFVNDSVGWAGGTRHIVHTTNGGDNWVVQSDGEGIYPSDMFFANKNNGWICGVIGGIFYTSDGGETWQRQYSGTSEVLGAIKFIDKNTGWIVGDHGLILHTTTGGITDVKLNYYAKHLKKNFHLFPNYPNPYNVQTMISYLLLEKGHVRLMVCDILGREVIMLVNELKPGGHHQVVWNGKNQEGGDVSSGMYFYHLQYEGVFQKTRKMILVR